MASIKFDITGDNKNFLDSMKQVRDDVSRTSKIIEEVGKNFNIATVDDKIEALSKVIRDNEDVILRHQNTINKWKKDAEAAFNSGDTKLFEVITNDIEAEAKSMQELINETNEYRDALAMVNAMAGNSTGNVTAPMLFNTEEEYRNVQRLTSGIEDLRMQIATFEGSESDLQGLRSQLSGMQDELRGAQMKAVEAAAALGEDGEKAAEVSQRFFQLSDAVDKQTGKVAELSNKLNDAATALENAKASGDTQAIDDATMKYDALADQLQSAKMELVNLRSEHEKVKMTFHGDSTMNLRTQLRNLTVEIATLTLNYRQMSDEEKRSSAGRELMMKLQELTTRAGDLRDAMADVNRAITSTASDTKNFDALAGGFNVVTSSIGAVTGAAALFGAEQEDLIAIQTKLQASLAISNALSVIQNNLQKESALMIGVTNLQRKAAVLGENLVIAAKGKNIIVTKAATVAQAAFNVVAKANPYVLLATALISVVGAIALFTSGTKEATQAEKLHQEALEKSKEAAEQYKNTLSSSYAGMMSKYSELRREWNRLSSDHQRTKWIKDNKSAFNELGLSVNGVKDAEDIFRNNTQNVVDSFKRRAQAAALAAQMTELYRQQMDLEQKYYDRYNTRKVYQGQAAPEGTSMYADRTGGTYNGGRYTYNQGSGKFAFTAKGAEEYNAALLESDASLVQINNDWKAIGDKIDDIDGKLQSLGETSTKKLSPSATTTGNTVNAANDGRKLLEERYRQQRELERTNRELELQTRQAEIDMMADGNDKVLAQIQLDFQRRAFEIEKGFEDLRQKKIENARKLWEADPKNKDKAFDPNSVDTTPTAVEQKNYDVRIQSNIEEYKRQIESLSKQELQYLYDFLSEYGTMEQKRYAVIMDYEEKITKETSENKKKLLEAERNSLLSQIEAQSIAEDIDWSQTFSGIGNVLQEIAKDTLKKVDDYMNTDEYKKLNASDKKAYQDLRNELVDAGGVDARSPFKSSTWDEISRLANQYKADVSSFLETQQRHKDAVDALIKAQEELKKATTPAAKALAQIKVDEAQATVNSTATEVNDAKDKKDKSNRDLHDATEAATQGLQNFSTILSQITSGTLSGFAVGVANLINQLSGSGNKVVASLGELGGKIGGIIGAILQIIDALGEDPAGFIKDLLDRIARVVEAILSDLPQLVVNIIGGVLNIVGGIIKGIGNLFSGSAAFGSNKDEMEARIEELKTANEALSKSIDDLAEVISRSDSTNKESIEAYQKQLQAAKEWQQNQRNAIDARASEWSNSGHGFMGLGGEHSFNYYLPDNTWSGWAKFSEVLRQNGYNTNVNRNNIWGLSPEEMQLLRDFAPAEWAKLLNGDGESNPKDLIDEYIESAGQIEELTSALNEKLTGYSWDGFLDSYKTLIKNLTSTTEDFGDKIEDIISNALLESLVNEEYRDRIKALYKYIADHAGDGLDETELNYIRSENEKIANEMIARRQNLIDAGLIKPTEDSEKYEQKASQGGWQSLGEDTGQEINGRFTALQASGERISEGIITMVTTMAAIYTNTETGNLTLLEIRNLMITNNAFLEDILEATKVIYKDFGKKLDKINSNTK